MIEKEVCWAGQRWGFIHLLAEAARLDFLDFYALDSRLPGLTVGDFIVLSAENRSCMGSDTWL